MQEVKEAVVADLSDLKREEMKKVEVHGKEVLLVRSGETLRAYSLECPHHGAKLHKGLHARGSIVCPWHHARFSVENGSLEAPPGLDGLVRFDVRVEEGKVIVTVPKKVKESRVPDLAPSDEQDKRRFVVLGGGAAGGAAVEELRRSGFGGHVLFITAERILPYDRTELSKEILQAEDSKEPYVFRDKNFFAKACIELKTGVKVKKLDSKARTIHLENGEEIEYHKLLIATGADPIALDVPGMNHRGVFLLRTPEHARHIVGAAKEARRAVVVGGGFIGMETAASLRKRGLEVTVVLGEELPLVHALGDQIGRFLMQMHERKGVRFRPGAKAIEFIGDNEHVERVKLEGGESIETDLVVVGVGVRPATEFIQDLPLMRDGGLRVDKGMRVEEGDGLIFAAGDVAAFIHPLAEDPVRFEHWRTAEQQGRTAARNMIGGSDVFDEIPFFWSDQFELSLGFVGYPGKADEVLIDGDLLENDFMAYYVDTQHGRIMAAAGAGRDRQMCAFEECLRLGLVPPLKKIDPVGTDWIEYLTV